MKKLFIAATRQNDGKTTVSLGLVLAFKRITQKIGFIKPVGQRYVEVNGQKVDEDSVLIEKVCSLDCHLQDMSPIAIEPGFTKKYLDGRHRNRLIERIKASFKKASSGKELILIEGTGHAGVGSVFELNNATVAKLLRAKVVLISIGGIGRPIDEIVLNQSLFEKVGVPICGVIINKVYPERLEETKEYLRKGLRNYGLDLLGAIPYEQVLSQPTLGQIQNSLKAKVVSGEEFLFRFVSRTVIGAMTPRHALNYLGERGSLLITPGDREDIILAALSMSLNTGGKESSICGIILTGNLKPHPSIIKLLKKAPFSTLSVPSDTYTTASSIHDLIVKIRETDIRKISLAKELVERYVDIDKIYQEL